MAPQELGALRIASRPHALDAMATRCATAFEYVRSSYKEWRLVALPQRHSLYEQKGIFAPRRCSTGRPLRVVYKGQCCVHLQQRVWPSASSSPAPDLKTRAPHPPLPPPSSETLLPPAMARGILSPMVLVLAMFAREVLGHCPTDCMSAGSLKNPPKGAYPLPYGNKPINLPSVIEAAAYCARTCANLGSKYFNILSNSKCPRTPRLNLRSGCPGPDLDLGQPWRIHSESGL